MLNQIVIMNLVTTSIIIILCFKERADEFNINQIDEDTRYLATLPFKNSKGMRVRCNK